MIRYLDCQDESRYCLVFNRVDLGQYEIYISVQRELFEGVSRVVGVMFHLSKTIEFWFAINLWGTGLLIV